MKAFYKKTWKYAKIRFFIKSKNIFYKNIFGKKIFEKIFFQIFFFSKKIWDKQNQSIRHYKHFIIHDTKLKINNKIYCNGYYAFCVFVLTMSPRILLFFTRQMYKINFFSAVKKFSCHKESDTFFDVEKKFRPSVCKKATFRGMVVIKTSRVIKIYVTTFFQHRNFFYVIIFFCVEKFFYQQKKFFMTKKIFFDEKKFFST